MNGWTLAQAKNCALEDVCKQHGVTREMLTGKRRTDPIAQARHDAMYRLRKLGLSYPRIGAILGGRHHTTVIHGVLKHAERNKLEPPE